MKNRKIYISPRTDLIKVSSEDSILVVKKSVQGHAGEPAKKNIWDTVGEESDSLYDFSRVGNSINKLWDD